MPPVLNKVAVPNRSQNCGVLIAIELVTLFSSKPSEVIEEFLITGLLTETVDARSAMVYMRPTVPYARPIPVEPLPTR